MSRKHRHKLSGVERLVHVNKWDLNFQWIYISALTHWWNVAGPTLSHGTLTRWWACLCSALPSWSERRYGKHTLVLTCCEQVSGWNRGLIRDVCFVFMCRGSWQDVTPCALATCSNRTNSTTSHTTPGTWPSSAADTSTSLSSGSCGRPRWDGVERTHTRRSAWSEKTSFNQQIKMSSGQKEWSHKTDAVTSLTTCFVVIIAWLPLKGTIGFEQHIDRCLDLSQYLYNKIKNREGYEMVFDGEVSFSNFLLFFFWFMSNSGMTEIFIGNQRYSMVGNLFLHVLLAIKKKGKNKCLWPSQDCNKHIISFGPVCHYAHAHCRQLESPAVEIYTSEAEMIARRLQASHRKVGL